MTARDFALALIVVLLLIAGVTAYLYYTRGPAVPARIDPKSIGYILA
jgi:hypothetical protein